MSPPSKSRPAVILHAAVLGLILHAAMHAEIDQSMILLHSATTAYVHVCIHVHMHMNVHVHVHDRACTYSHSRD